MGWFWSNEAVSAKQDDSILSTPSQSGSILWAQNEKPLTDSDATPNSTSTLQSDTPKCPVDHTKFMKKPAAKPAAEPSKCPVDHTKLMPRQPDTAIDPTNNMPVHLPTAALPGQNIALPTERTISSIPRGEDANRGNWEYPSPQQMLNAMVRKSGRDGIDEEAVESMVDVHNFLNEGCWNEVLEWEQPHTAASGVEPRLLKFTGRPQDTTPRVRWLQFLSYLRPKAWDFTPPFDRHDWTVLRHSVKGDSWDQVRYVIDFYEAPDENGMPAFNIDVRPALDSFGALTDRIRKLTAPVWDANK